MGKLKDGVKNIVGKIKGSSDKKQSKAFVRIVQFFAVMLALTIFARGVTGATMPLVTVAPLSQQNIRNDEEFSGVIHATNSVDEELPVGLTVEKVFVSSGNTVQVGDDLVSFDTDAMDMDLTTKRIELQELQLALAELQKPFTQDDTALTAAQQAQAAAQQGYDKAVQASQTDIEAAHAAAASAQAVVVALQNEIASLSALIPAETDPDEVRRMQERVATATTELATAQEKYSAAQANVQTTQTSANDSISAAQSTLSDANTALSEAQAAYNEGTPAFNLESQKRQLQITQKKQEIVEKQEEVDKLTALVASGGTIKATVEGVITDVTVAKGALTTDADYVRISTGAEGYLAQFSVSIDNARNLRVGDIVSVTTEDSYGVSEARITNKSVPDESGMVNISAQLNDTGYSEGDAVKVTAIFSDSTYWTCVPLQAVRPDSGGYYVLMLSEQSSVLGTQTVAQKVPVTIIAQDETYAAIDGIYEQSARIVVSGTKPVSSGDAVRVDEESTQ